MTLVGGGPGMEGRQAIGQCPLWRYRSNKKMNSKRSERKSIEYLDWKGMLESLIDLDY
jgi:hypothetical protein